MTKTEALKEIAMATQTNKKLDWNEGGCTYGDRKRALWDESLLIGPCCACDVPAICEVPICKDLYRIQMACQTVGELVDASKAHKLVCRVCNPELLEELREAA